MRTGSVSLVGDELGDAAAHDAGAEHRRPRAPRAAAPPGRAVVLLRRSSIRWKTWTRFLEIGAVASSASAPRLGVEAGSPAVLDPDAHHLEGASGAG